MSHIGKKRIPPVTDKTSESLEIHWAGFNCISLTIHRSISQSVLGNFPTHLGKRVVLGKPFSYTSEPNSNRSIHKIIYYLNSVKAGFYCTIDLWNGFILYLGRKRGKTSVSVGGCVCLIGCFIVSLYMFQWSISSNRFRFFFMMVHVDPR